MICLIILIQRASNNESLLETLRQISVNEYGDALTPVEEKVLKIYEFICLNYIYDII